MQCVKVTISGKVQGVGYRYFVKQKALELGLRGYVKNLADGRVEAVFCGRDELLPTMMDWCEEGPPLSEVTEVEVERFEGVGNFENFVVRQ